MLYGLAVSRGLPPPRAREYVAAAYAESNLNPQATNPRSGAAGFYQLLSGGYRQRAQQLGGLYNPRANALAILPDYQRYWQQHPGAAPGAAGRDVERSGMGAGFYSQPLGLLGGLAGGGAAPPPMGQPPAGPPVAPVAPQAAAPDPRRLLASALLSASQSGNYGGFFQTLQRVRQQQTRPLAQAPAVTPRTVTARPTPTVAATPAPAATAAWKYPTMQTGGKVPLPGLNPVTHTDWQHVDTGLLSKLSRVARQLGVTITLTSGYRSPGYSARVGGYSNDPHTRGEAVDAYINGTPIGSYPGAYKLLTSLGLESGAQPGFYHGKTDPEHVQIPGSGVNKSLHASSVYGR